MLCRSACMGSGEEVHDGVQDTSEDGDGGESKEENSGGNDHKPCDADL